MLENGDKYRLSSFQSPLADQAAVLKCTDQIFVSSSLSSCSAGQINGYIPVLEFSHTHKKLRGAAFGANINDDRVWFVRTGALWAQKRRRKATESR